jgi:peptidoglycan/xylan/chitin deacetylase (PgdA/CDA1 family)
MRHYHIIMWDVLSGDFDPKISAEQCLANVTDHTEPGSIVVFHDSLKAKDKLAFVLPRVLKHFSSQGYKFDAITESALFLPSETQQQRA